MTTDLHKEMIENSFDEPGINESVIRISVAEKIFSKALKSEHKRGYKDGILMGHFEEAEDKVWYVKQAEKRGYKRGREEGINELMKKIRNKLVETKPMHDRRYEGNYEIEVFDGGFYWMKGRAEGILDEVLDTLKPKKNE
jgi:hypothetical protein